MVATCLLPDVLRVAQLMDAVITKLYGPTWSGVASRLIGEGVVGGQA